MEGETTDSEGKKSVFLHSEEIEKNIQGEGDVYPITEKDGNQKYLVEFENKIEMDVEEDDLSRSPTGSNIDRFATSKPLNSDEKGSDGSNSPDLESSPHPRTPDLSEKDKNQHTSVDPETKLFDEHQSSNWLNTRDLDEGNYSDTNNQYQDPIKEQDRGKDASKMADNNEQTEYINREDAQKIITNEINNRIIAPILYGLSVLLLIASVGALISGSIVAGLIIMPAPLFMFWTLWKGRNL